MRQRLIVLAGAAFLAAGCGLGLDPGEREVQRAVARVKTIIDMTALDQRAALGLAASQERTGTIAAYLAANFGENKGSVAFPEQPQPYSVLVRPSAIPGEFLIEGFGRSADKPLFVRRAKATPPRRGRA